MNEPKWTPLAIKIDPDFIRMLRIMELRTAAANKYRELNPGCRWSTAQKKAAEAVQLLGNVFDLSIVYIDKDGTPLLKPILPETTAPDAAERPTQPALSAEDQKRGEEALALLEQGVMDLRELAESLERPARQYILQTVDRCYGFNNPAYPSIEDLYQWFNPEARDLSQDSTAVSLIPAGN